MKTVFLHFVVLLSALLFYSTPGYCEPTEFVLALARSTTTPAEETFTYAIPKQLGYFYEENINPTLLYTDGSTAALQAVATGSADIAYASSANIAAAIDKGVPLKAFAGITVKWPYFIGVPKGSYIHSIADLKGTRIGVISLASASYADLRANLKLAGLSESDVTIVPVGAGARAAAALNSGDIDAVDSYSDSFTVMRQHGVEFNLLQRPEQMNRLFSVTMVTSQKIFDKKPDELSAFARAAYKGIIYTKLYPESALKLAFKEFPELSGADNISGKDAQNTAEAMAIALADSIPTDKPDPSTWGWWLDIPAQRWQAVLSFAYETGSTERLLAVKDVWNDSLMPKIYNFDIKSIVEKN
ncbi:ABC transporter substrate-binding protein [uncultured Bartonella sp.]|uniref:ABC transporter substrate-binding protein n=1 Tax=uncultured Bartonella sp. TaxID=104108 RepID=UPI00260846F0|nr:ABC transporter substrate-binding protein [uncultured Bartonella sp.]